MFSSLSNTFHPSLTNTQLSSALFPLLSHSMSSLAPQLQSHNFSQQFHTAFQPQPHPFHMHTTFHCFLTTLTLHSLCSSLAITELPTAIPWCFPLLWHFPLSHIYATFHCTFLSLSHYADTIFTTLPSSSISMTRTDLRNTPLLYTWTTMTHLYNYLFPAPWPKTYPHEIPVAVSGWPRPTYGFDMD